MYDDPEAWTNPERACQRAQVREKKCAVCLNRRVEGYVDSQPVLGCHVNLHWPKYGTCVGFELDEGGVE